MPVVPFIPAIIGGATSLIGGALGSGASGRAAQLQYQSTIEARKQLMDLLNQYNPAIGTAADRASQLALDAAAQGREGLASATLGGQTGATAAAQRANELLDPFLSLGTGATTTLAGLMAPGGDLSRNFTAADMATMDPGYQFRIDQANQALAASAAARGGALGGGAAKALTRYSQDVASSELGNAFDRFRAAQTDRFNRLNTLVNLGANTAGAMGANTIGAGQFAANLGMRGSEDISDLMQRASQYAGTAGLGAAEQMASNAMTTGRSIADLITGGGNAQAAGTVGAANAWSSALGGVGNALAPVGNYFLNQRLIRDNPDIFRNPAIIRNYGGGYA